MNLRAAALALALLQLAFAQQCYYPNGANAPEKPCSSAKGSACCPDKWECMDNGLCYYEPDDLYGRYSCTDKTWESSGCPSNMCTYDLKAAGGEAVTQCSNHNNQWCCDANRVDVDCCQESPEPRPFFALQDPVAYGTAGGRTGSSAPNLASITGLASGSGDSSPSSTSPPSSSASTSGDSSSITTASSSGPSTPVTSVGTTVSSGSAGPVTLTVTTVIQPPSETPNPSPSSPEKQSKLPLIVGCAVGIPLGLAFLGILFWLFRKRAHQKRNPYTETPDPYPNGSDTANFAGGAKLRKSANSATKYEQTDPGVPELGGGQGVGPERPVSLIPGKAEMDSGGGFAPGTTPQAPHLVGVGGGNGRQHTPGSSWGSAPPNYSPPHDQQSWAGADPARNSGQYVAYRPPSSQPGSGLNNVPEMAELPAVTTPPAELGNPSPPAAGTARAESGAYPGMDGAAAHK